MSPAASDIVVIGGGPVGLYAAASAAQRGFSVTVVEPRRWPIDKACGEGLMPAAVELLAGLGVEPPGEDFVGITYLDAKGARRATAVFHDGKGKGVRRLLLSEHLASRAKELHVESVAERVVGVGQSHDRVSVLLQGGGRLSARYVLGADGLHSKVRSWVGIDSSVRTPARYGLRQHFRIAPWRDTVEVYWSQQSEAYVTPVGPDEVGVALLSQRHGGTFDTRVRDFPMLRERLGDAPTSSSVRGAGPLWQHVVRRTSGRALLIGDAAGYVDALTGEGLALGFRCADAALDAIRDQEPLAYEHSWQSLTRQYRVLTGGLVQATRVGWLRKALVPTAGTAPQVFGAIVNRLG